MEVLRELEETKEFGETIIDTLNIQKGQINNVDKQTKSIEYNVKRGHYLLRGMSFFGSIINYFIGVNYIDDNQIISFLFCFFLIYFF